MKIKFLFIWYDLWIGLYWNRKTKLLYFFPFPMIGVCIDLRSLFCIINGHFWKPIGKFSGGVEYCCQNCCKLHTSFINCLSYRLSMDRILTLSSDRIIND